MLAGLVLAPGAPGPDDDGRGGDAPPASVAHEADHESSGFSDDHVLLANRQRSPVRPRTLWHRGHGQNFMDQAINGLSFNATTRTLSGTPTAAGVWQLSYVVHDDDDDRSVDDRFRARTNLQVTVSQ